MTKRDLGRKGTYSDHVVTGILLHITSWVSNQYLNVVYLMILATQTILPNPIKHATPNFLFNGIFRLNVIIIGNSRMSRSFTMLRMVMARYICKKFGRQLTAKGSSQLLNGVQRM